MKNIIKSIKYNLIPYLLAIPTYIKQNECQSYIDCVLLHKLIQKAPRYYDRAIEYPWALRNVDLKKGRFLDVGSTVGLMFRENLPKEVEVFAINSDSEQRFGEIKGVKTILGDIRKTDFESNLFDVITCISTLEHIGVEGRYNIKSDPSGDLKAAKEMLRILKPKGKLLITVPYGKYDVLPINKLYNKERIKEITKGYNILSSNYMKFDPKWNIWKDVSEQEAASTDWKNERWYSIAFYILEKPGK